MICRLAQLGARGSGDGRATATVRRVLMEMAQRQATEERRRQQQHESVLTHVLVMLLGLNVRMVWRGRDT